MKKFMQTDCHQHSAITRAVARSREGRVWAYLCWLLAAAIFLMCGMANATEIVTYYYTDAQGTPLATADAQGNILSIADYRPYAVQALGQPVDGVGYTGHVADEDIGLVYMQARYYDPEIGRFISKDPLPSGFGRIFSFNRYTYANNSPQSNIDPDGQEAACVSQTGHCDDGGAAAKAGVQVLAGASSTALNSLNQNVIIPAIPMQPELSVAAESMEGVAAMLDGVAAGLLGAAPEVEVATGVASGSDVPLPTAIPDSALVARGGAAANQTAQKIDAAIGDHPSGVTGFSAQCNGGTCLQDLGSAIPNKQLGVTTAGQIRALGGDVIQTSGRGNHVTVTNLSGDAASSLFKVEANPNPMQH